ncbi:MAG TPA: sulfonate ABC transporter [Deltaproteobacteria bacterium]|nr:sulfonate ABC transporter [Deltaproteobacteria bacterium]
MALKGVVQYLTCPMCDADVPLSEDEKAGEEVYCPYCQVPLKVRKKKGSEELFLEENF